MSDGRGGGDLPLTYQGTYDATRTYLPRQVVKVGDHPYMALSKILGFAPPDPAHWLDLGGAAVTLASLGGSRSTVGLGLPSLIGRSQGDLHYDSTIGKEKEYVLTGVFGTSDIDNFARPDGAVGSTPGGRAWVADGSGGARPTIAGQAAVQRANSVRGGHLINIGSAATGGYVQATIHQGATYNTDLSSATLYLGTGTTPDGPSDLPNGGWLCNINGANSGGAGIMDLVGPDGVVINSPSAAANVVTANETATFSLEVSADGKTGKVFKNGTLILARTVAAACTGTYAGFQLASGSAGATGTAYLDDIAISVGGSVAWTPPPTRNAENVLAIAASGAAVTIPDPEIQAVTRVVLTANCTFTFPAPAAGKTFTLTLVQDATGSRTAAWPASVKWPGGTAPTLTTTAGKADVFSFMADDATNWRGSVVGLNY